MPTVDANEEILKAAVEAEEGMVLVDSWAEWCGSCKMFGPDAAGDAF